MIPYTPQQNGVSERMNRSIMETVRCLLHYANLPLDFWAEAVATAVFLRNSSPTSYLKEVTPYQCWFREKPDVSNLRVFGCKALVHIPEQKRKKLDKKSMECIFVGYPYNSKGYKLYNPETKQMLRSRDVIFLEDTFESDLSDCNQDKELLLDEKPSVKLDPLYFEGGVNINIDNENHENCMRDINVDDVIPATEGRPQRNRIAPDRLGAITGNWWDYVDYASIAVADNDEPRNVREAFTGQNAKQWKGATDAEFQSLLKNQTWDLVDLPEDKKVIGCKWVFKLKRDANGEITRYKARLVAQGYSQEAGIDYDEVFAPVTKYDSIRSILAIANQLDLEVHQMDVKTAFLHGDLDL